MVGAGGNRDGVGQAGQQGGLVEIIIAPGNHRAGCQKGISADGEPIVVGDQN